MKLHKRKKMTNQQIENMFTGMVIQIEQLKRQIYAGDKALDEYLKMKGEKEKFVKYLENNLIDDNNNKKTEKE